MYDCSNSTTTGQVFDVIHHWKDRLSFGLNFILPVAELKQTKKKKQKKKNTTIKYCSGS